MTAIPFRQTPYYEILKPDLAGLEGTSAEVIRHAREYAAWMESIPEAKLDHAYAPGKWTPRVMLGHIVDSHIIILFRILTFGRGDTLPIPVAQEEIWAANSGHDRMAKADLVRGYRRAAGFSEWLVETLPAEAMDRSGVANGMLLTVRELHAYLVAHEIHHRRILRERYAIA